MCDDNIMKNKGNSSLNDDLLLKNYSLYYRNISLVNSTNQIADVIIYFLKIKFR